MKRRFGISAFACVLLLPGAGHAMEAHLADVFPVALDFCPSDSVPADGRKLSIHENQAIYSLLQHDYRSTDQRSFTLPDLNSGTAALTLGAPKMLWCFWTRGSYPPREH